MRDQRPTTWLDTTRPDKAKQAERRIGSRRQEDIDLLELREVVRTLQIVAEEQRQLLKRLGQ